MKVAIYPGSFNPLHRGHVDVIEKALKVFDKVILAKGINPDKNKIEDRFIKHGDSIVTARLKKLNPDKSLIDIEIFDGLLTNYIEDKIVHSDGLFEYAIIKGLRNGQDLEFEKNQQYWNEDLGINIPFFYIIADRNNCHISSSAIRGLEKFNM